MALTSPAQTISVPLGQAANFGLLSGGSITADTLAGVRVRGAVGANGTITGNVTADGGIYRPSGPTATTALADLDSAKAYCTALSGQSISGTLGGVSLAPGVYNISGNATLASNAVLTLTGGPTDVYVFNITGQLVLNANSTLASGWVPPKNIYWNIGGKVQMTGHTTFKGLLLAGDSIVQTGTKNGVLALLTTGSRVVVQGMQSTTGDNQLFARVTMGGNTPSTECQGTALQLPNLVWNPSFEDAAPNYTGAGRSNMMPFTSEACWWYNPTDGTADYFRRNAISQEVGAPNNCYGTNQQPRTDDAYAGIWMRNLTQGGQNYEYLQVPIAPVVPRMSTIPYYCGFFWSHANQSSNAVQRLGLCLSNAQNTPLLPTNGLYNLTGTPGARWVEDDRSQTGGALVNNGWSVIGGLVNPVQPLDMLTIGTFQDDGRFPDVNANRFFCNQVQDPEYTGAYYYIDDVVVWPLPEMPTTATVCTGLNTTIGLAVPVEVPLALNVTYQWFQLVGTTPTAITPDGNGPQLMVGTPGQYFLVMTIEGTPYQYPTVTVSPAAGPSLTVSPGTSFTRCAGNLTPITLTVGGGVAPYQFTAGGQPVPGATVQPSATQPNVVEITFTPLPTTTTYTITDGTSGCPGTASVTVTVSSGTPITIQGNPLICPNSSTLLTASGIVPVTSTTYTWTGPVVTPTNAHSTSINIPSTSVVDQVNGDLYTLTGIDANGCTSTTSIRVKRFFDYENGGTVGTNFPTTIGRNMRIRGTIIVPAGQTLEIEDATLEFADSRAQNATVYTRILVQRGGIINGVERPGGALRVINAELIPLQPNPFNCEAAAMWDGIVVEGVPSERQVAVYSHPIVYQGLVSLSNVRIEDARYGILAGAATYNTSRLLTMSVGSNGGGIVQAANTTFRNCFTGAYFDAWRPNADPDADNISYFSKCTFESTRFLADPIYQFGTGTTARRYGMQYGGRLNQLAGVSFTKCRFSGNIGTPRHSDRGYGIFGSDASVQVNCDVYSTTAADFPNSYVTEGCLAGPCTFENFYMGLYVANTNAYASTCKGATFTNNWRGLVLNTANSSIVRGNKFYVGTTSDVAISDPAGAILAASVGVQLEANSFYQNTGLYSIGLGVSQSGNAAPQPGASPYYQLVYRNWFNTGLDRGLYLHLNNPGLEFRCNKFEGTISNADVYLLGGTSALAAIPTQGDCGVITPNNLFSHTATKPSLKLWTNSMAFQYNYANDAGMDPVNVSNTGVLVNGVSQVIDDHPCGTSSAGSCAASAGRPASVVRQELSTTTNAAARGQLLAELLQIYLNDTLSAHGVDSAIALLQAENNPAYQTTINQMLARLGQYGGASSRVTKTGAQSRRAIGEANATSSQTGNPDYFQRVLDLLTPYDNDSLRRVAVLTDLALRAELFQMANDSLTWGSQAARTTLNRYAGTHYREWLGGEELVDEAGEGAAAGQRTAIAAGSLVLQPNPSEGPLEVHYQLPAKTAQAVLVIYDSWGREVARYGLEPERTSQQVLLRLRGGLYQCALLADGVVVTKERLLLSR